MKSIDQNIIKYIMSLILNKELDNQQTPIQPRTLILTPSTLA